MRNARTLIERVVIAKAIEGELKTFDVDLHHNEEAYEVYVFDPEEAFTASPLSFPHYAEAKAAFSAYVEIIMQESVYPTDAPVDFAERVFFKLTKKIHNL